MTLHIHFHGNVEITFPPTGDIPSPLFDSLKELLTMNQTELKTALADVAAQLTTFGTGLDAGVAQLSKALDELVVAQSNAGSTTPEVDAALAAVKAAADALNGKGDAVAAVAQALDDLNPDAAPAP